MTRLRFYVCLCAAMALVALLGACAGDPPTSGLSSEQQGVAACVHRAGISQLDVNHLFVICRDGTLHDLEETR